MTFRSVLAAAVAIVMLATTSAIPAATPPPKLTKPYPGNLWALYGTGCAGITTTSAQNIANNLNFVNSHTMLPTAKFWMWYPDCPQIGGMSIKQYILNRNPNFIFSNYRNGSYTQQHNVEEAAESEQRFPLGIAVWDTQCKLGSSISASDVNLTLTRGVTQSGTPDIFPWKTSKTTQTYSVDKNNYVAWMRIGNEIIRINTATWNGTTSRIEMTVQRGIWGTTATSHATTDRVFQPVYIGSVTTGADTSLSGIPDNTSPQMGIRYAYVQEDAGFQQWLGDKSQHYFDHGVDVVWLDVTSSQRYNNGDAFGYSRSPWDFATNSAVTSANYTEYQQRKIDALFARFPNGKFFINNMKGEQWFTHEQRFFTGKNASGQVVHHPVTGGCMEFYVEKTNFTNWQQDVNMTLDMVAKNFWGIAWAKGSDASYKKWAYCSYLMAYEPGCRVTFGSDWGLTGVTNSTYDYLRYDLGQPIDHFTNISQGLTSTSNVYRRRFQKGMVVINTATSSRSYPLGESLYDLDTGTFVTSVTMGAMSGKILMKSNEAISSAVGATWQELN